MSDIDDPRCIPHLRGLSGTSFVEMRAARSQAPVCGVCTSLVLVGEESSASKARRKRKASVSRHKYSQGRREEIEGAEDGRGAIRGEEGIRRSWRAIAPPRSPHLCDQAKERDELQKVEAQWRPAQPLPSFRTGYPRRNRRLHSGEVAARGCGGKGVRERDASGG
ncbi:hypothetical protein B0H13DRAFT_2069669 [Mycena leptocephala]|nr:hypothetical protein B0H13DRAFT_2069669 [Mycena leptocephala]